MPNLPEYPFLIVVIAWYGFINAVAWWLFFRDKRAAERGAWRIRERRLLATVWLGGFIGAVAAMRFARHKTRKWLFRLTPWGAGALHMAAWVLVMRESR